MTGIKLLAGIAIALTCGLIFIGGKVVWEVKDDIGRLPTIINPLPTTTMGLVISSIPYTSPGIPNAPPATASTVESEDSI